METPQSESRERAVWVWAAIAAGGALGIIGLIYLFYRDPGRRMNRLLLRCEDRIHHIEAALADLNESLQSTPS
jgi:hypothetical protein